MGDIVGDAIEFFIGGIHAGLLLLLAGFIFGFGFFLAAKLLGIM